MALTLATRPQQTCKTGTPIQLASNFFRFTPMNTNQYVQKYSVSLNPDVAASLFKQRERIFRRAASVLVPQIGKYVFANTALYCIQSSSGGSEQTITETVEFDGVSYEIVLVPTGKVESPQEVRHFYNRFFNSVQGTLQLIQIGRKFYNPDNPVNLPQHHITIWPGYATAVGSYAGGCYVNIDISHRCLRTITVYDQILEIRNRPHTDHIQATIKLLLGTTVLTLYNKKTYKILDIDWDSTVLSTFADDKGNTQSYKDYYEKRWQKEIKHNEQPLLKATFNKNPKPCMLIPEFCVLTGLTDEMRADFNVMKDMATATKKEPHDRLMLSAGLINNIKNNAKASAAIEQWKINLSPDPVKITGRTLPLGGIVLGNNQNFNINQTGSFDREAQTKMFTQPKLNVWGVFHCQNDTRLVESFMGVLQQVIKTYNVDCNKPRLFAVRTDRWDDWERELKTNLNPQVQAVICVLPGARGKSRLYDDLKRLVISQLPVPTQCILTGTLKKEKGLRSVVNKLIMQINAKVGGVPWALSQMPFNDQKTMIVGVDVFSKRGGFSVLGFCATMDQYYSTYVTVPQLNQVGTKDTSELKKSMYTAMVQYFSTNSQFPRRVVVFRDGVSEGQKQTVLDDEVRLVKQAFQQLREESKITEDPKLIYVGVNKRTNARFYAEQAKMSNPPIGTCIDTVTVEEHGYDFFILPAKTNQGAMTPTHFHVLYDDSGCPCDEIQQLAFKMCFSYYNWSGSIRVPAPCQYAHKLAYFVGERANNQGPPIPHSHWANTRSLYFL